MNLADREPDEHTPERVANLKHKVATIRAHMQELIATGEKLENRHLISETDPDARSMVSQGRGTGMVGYNVQTAVDSENYLIVAHEVTNSANDRIQLANMSLKVRGWKIQKVNCFCFHSTCANYGHKKSPFISEAWYRKLSKTFCALIPPAPAS